jgi:hypothetical protein
MPDHVFHKIVKGAKAAAKEVNRAFQAAGASPTFKSQQQARANKATREVNRTFKAVGTSPVPKVKK